MLPKLLHQGRTRRGESEPGSCDLGTSEPTAPPRSRPPIGLGRTNRVPPRPRLPVGPRANWPCSASPEAGLVPQPRRLRLKGLSGRLSHPINALSCTRYVSHDRQCAATGATGQRSDHLFYHPLLTIQVPYPVGARLALFRLMAAETRICTWVTSQASARQASAQQASARPATMAAEPLQSTKSTNAQHVTCSGDHTD